MTGSAAVLDDAWWSYSSLDRAVSDDALRLREFSTGIADVPWSVSYDERRTRWLAALDRAAAEAAIENWDGAGARAANPMSYVYTRSLLLSLPSWVPDPEVTVDTDGDFSVEWDREPRSVFAVSVSRDGTLSYAALFGVRVINGSEPYSDVDPPSLVLDCIRQASGIAVSH